MNINWQEIMLQDLQNRANELEELNEEINRNMKHLKQIREALDKKPVGIQANLFGNTDITINPYDGVAKVIRDADQKEIEKNNRLIIDTANEHLTWIRFISKVHYQNGAGIPVPANQKEPEWNISVYTDKVKKRYGQAS